MTFREYLKNILIQIKNYIDYSFSGINVKKFGAKGDGITDDTHAIQEAIDYARNNNIYCVYFPTPKKYYKTTKPILIQCYSNQDGTMDDVRWWEGRSPRLFGDSKSTTIIKKEGAGTITIPNTNWNGFNDPIDATFVIANEDGSEKGSGAIFEQLNIKNASTNETHYAIYGDRSRTTIRHCNARTNSKGIRLHSFFNELSDLYIACLSDGIHITNGTSTIMERIYCSSGMTNPYKIFSAYSTITSCCADGCLGSIFTLDGFGLTLNGCGTESPDCDYLMTINANSNVVVNGFYAWRQVGGTPIYFADDASLTINGLQLIEKSSVSDYGESYIVDLSSKNWTTVRLNLSNFSIMRTPTRDGQLPKLFKKVPRARSKIYLATDDLSGYYQVTADGLVPYEGKGTNRMYLSDAVVPQQQGGALDSSKLYPGMIAYNKSLGLIQVYDGTKWNSCPPEIITPANTNFIDESNGEFVQKAQFTNKFSTSDSNYASGNRMTSAGVLTPDSSFFVSGFISAPNLGDVIRVRSRVALSTARPLICQFNPSTHEVMGSPYWAEGLQMDEDGMGFTFTMPYAGRCVRVSSTDPTDYVVTVNEEIVYNNVWEGEPLRLNEAIYSQNAILKSPNGTTYELLVANDGTLSTKVYEV